MSTDNKQDAKVDFGKSPIEFLHKENVSTIRLRGALSKELLVEFEKQLESQKPAIAPNNVMVDMKEVTDLHQVWLRPLVGLNHFIKEKGKKLRFVNLSENIRSIITHNGLNQTLVFVADETAALQEFNAKSVKKLDVQFVNPFLAGTIETLKIQAQIEAKAGAPFKKAARDSLSGDISGVIGLVSDHFTGSVVISFPEKTFLAIINKMLGENYTQLTPEIQDGAAELTNIIFGFAKRDLNEKGYGIKMAIPSVVSGKDHSISNNSHHVRISIPFESSAGNFNVEICLSE